MTKQEHEDIMNGKPPLINNRKSVFDSFKEQGYVTAIAKDYCEALNPERGIFKTKVITGHHEGYAYSCYEGNSIGSDSTPVH